jgi:hypothetical protein
LNSNFKNEMKIYFLDAFIVGWHNLNKPKSHKRRETKEEIKKKWNKISIVYLILSIVNNLQLILALSSECILDSIFGSLSFYINIIYIYAQYK